MTKNQAQQWFKQNKFNNGQHTRKVQHFKRKHWKSNGHKETALHQTADMGQSIEENSTFSVSTASMIKKKWYPLHMVSNVEPSQFLFHYSIMANTGFKEKLSAFSSVQHFDMNLLNQFLDSDEKVPFIRQLFELINKLNYAKLQDEQWAYYYHLGLTENIWTGRVPKKMAQVNSMPHTYGRRKLLIEQRRKYFQEQLQEITHQIQEHLKQNPCSTIDSNRLVSTITDLVAKDQFPLRIELERRRHVLKFDAKDHQLVEAFYQLKPRQTEIHSAKVIWKAIHDEQALRYEIAMFKSWFSHETRSTTCAFQDLALTKITETFTNRILDQHLSSTTCSSEHAAVSINKFIEDSAQQAISTAETIAQLYLQKANDEKQKILSNRDKFKKPPSVDAVVTTIENRQMNMSQRGQVNTEQRLKSLLFHLNTPKYSSTY